VADKVEDKVEWRSGVAGLLGFQWHLELSKNISAAQIATRQFRIKTGVQLIKNP
jgi:hypothetical protein